MFVSPPFLLLVVFAVTSPWHYAASAYFFLRTMLITPNGGIAWFAIVLIVAAAIGGVTLFSIRLRQVRSQAIAGVMAKPSPWLMVASIVGMKLLVGPVAALFVWSGLQAEGTLSVPKKGIFETPEMRLRIMLKSAEHRGVTTWLVNAQDSKHEE